MVRINLSQPWDYDPKRPLGAAGGFGAVFEGYGADNRAVAIKILHGAEPGIGQRELDFAKASIGRVGRHVITVYDCGVDGDLGKACIVMERAEESLRDRLK